MLCGVPCQMLSPASVLPSCTLVFASPRPHLLCEARVTEGGWQGPALSRHPANGQASIWQAQPSPWKMRGFLLR